MQWYKDTIWNFHLPERKLVDNQDTPIQIVCIHGSSNQNGLTSLLVKRACQGAREAGAKTKVIRLTQMPLPFFAPETEPTPSVLCVFQMLREADAMIWVTPTRYFNASPHIMNLINWLDHFHGPPWPLNGKAAGFMAGCEEDGGQSAVNAMMIPLQHLGVTVPTGGVFFYNKNMAERSEDRWMLTDMTRVGRNVTQLARILRENPYAW